MSLNEPARHEVGIVQRKRHVSACADHHSVWVEIAGPKGGSPWEMSPSVARGLAALLNQAADQALALDATAAPSVETTHRRIGS